MNIDPRENFAELVRICIEAQEKRREAEQEIKRLKARLKPRIDTVEGIPTGYGEDEIDRLQVEVERLKAELELKDDRLDFVGRNYHRVIEERDKLREALRQGLDLTSGSVSREVIDWRRTAVALLEGM